MNSFEISCCLRSDTVIDEINLGVFAANRLPTIHKLPCCFVANTDPDTHPGTHWVGFYIDESGECDYFDSYGRKPNNPHFNKFLRNYDVNWNDKQIQAYFSSACGQHSIYFLHERCRGVGFENIMTIYGKDLDDNDTCVVDYVDTVMASGPELQGGGGVCQGCARLENL